MSFRRAAVLQVLAVLAAPSAQAWEGYAWREVPPSDLDPIAIARPALPATHVGASVRIPIPVRGSRGGYDLSATGLPEGLALEGQAIVGSPTQTGVSTVTVTARDESGASVTADVDLVVLPPLVVTVPSVSIPRGRPYKGPPAGLDGAPAAPVRFAPSAGTLPPGLVVDPEDGSLSGTPDQPGISTFTVEAVDATGARATSSAVEVTVGAGGGGGEGRTVGFVVSEPASVPTRVGDDVRTEPPVLSGNHVDPVSWTLVEPIPGVEVAADGRLVGSVTAPGSYASELKAVDAAGSTAYSASFTVVASPALSMPDLRPVAATVGRPVRITPPSVANRPSGRITWLAGGLPPGLVVMPDSGIVTGVPTTAGTYAVTLVATDEEGSNAAASLDVTVGDVGGGPAVAPLAPSFHVGSTRVPLVAVEGGERPLAFALASGSLPRGASIDPDTGDLVAPDGLAPQAGTLEVSLAVTGADGRATVTPPLPLRVLPRYANAADTLSARLAVGVVHRSAPPAPPDALAPLSWTASAGFPAPGLTLDPATGAVSGSPTLAGSFSGLVSFRDRYGAIGQVANANGSLVVSEVVDGPSDSQAEERVVVHAGAVYLPAPRVPTRGGDVSWSLRGSLPPGLAFRAGTVFGSVLTGPPLSFAVVAIDAGGHANALRRTVTVRPPLVATPPDDATLLVGRPYVSTPPSTTDAEGAVTWTVNWEGGRSGGLSCDPATGVVSGYPDGAGRLVATLVARDAIGGLARTSPLTLDVVDPGRARAELRSSFSRP